jgi:hypothetical protein
VTTGKEGRVAKKKDSDRVGVEIPVAAGDVDAGERREDERRTVRVPTPPDPVPERSLGALVRLDEAIAGLGEMIIRGVHPHEAPRLRAALYPSAARPTRGITAEVEYQAERLEAFRTAWTNAGRSTVR